MRAEAPASPHRPIMNAPRCPLCEAANSCSDPVLDVTHVIEKLGLGGDLDVLLNSDTPIPRSPLTRLITCECGFEFFWPNITADGGLLLACRAAGRLLHRNQVGPPGCSRRTRRSRSRHRLRQRIGNVPQDRIRVGTRCRRRGLNPTRPIDLPAQVTVVHGAMQDLPAHRGGSTEG